MIDCSRCARQCYLAARGRVETCDAFLEGGARAKAKNTEKQRRAHAETQSSQRTNA